MWLISREKGNICCYISDVFHNWVVIEQIHTVPQLILRNFPDLTFPQSSLYLSRDYLSLILNHLSWLKCENEYFVTQSIVVWIHTVSQLSLRNFPDLFTKLSYLKDILMLLVVELCDLHHGKLFSFKAKPQILTKSANPSCIWPKSLYRNFAGIFM